MNNSADIEAFLSDNQLKIDEEVSIKKLIKEGCAKEDFSKLMKYLIHIFCLPPCELVSIALKLAEIKPCNSTIEILCLLIEEYTADYALSYRLYGDVKKLQEGLEKICKELNCLTDDTKYRFAQTLEFMYAYGYTGLNRIIYNVYESISHTFSRYYNEVSLSKKLSCVYIVNYDNYNQICSICYGIKEELKRSGSKHLIGLCNYYIGILEYYQNPPSNDLDYFRTELNSMEKSRKKGFKLAEIFLEHRALNNSETPKALESPYGAWLLGGDSNEE